MLKITPNLAINEAEIKITFIASPGPGGQNVNKLATAALLRFNILDSPSLPEDVRARLIAILGNKLTNQGELIIKASCHRTQERNKQDALNRLIALVKRATIIPKKRRKTKPTYASTQKRLNKKKLQGNKKLLRRNATED